MGWRAQCEGYRGERYSQVKEMLPKKRHMEVFGPSRPQHKALGKITAVKVKEKPKTDIFS